MKYLSLILVGLVLIAATDAAKKDKKKIKNCVCTKAKTGEYPPEFQSEAFDLDADINWAKTDNELRAMCKLSPEDKVFRPQVDVPPEVPKDKKKKKKKSKSSDASETDTPTEPNEAATETDGKKKKKSKKSKSEVGNEAMSEPPVGTSVAEEMTTTPTTITKKLTTTTATTTKKPNVTVKPTNTPSSTLSPTTTTGESTTKESYENEHVYGYPYHNKKSRYDFDPFFPPDYYPDNPFYNVYGYEHPYPYHWRPHGGPYNELKDYGDDVPCIENFETDIVLLENVPLTF